jgi:phosphoribosyl-dephospho-CoA transferase
MATSLGFMAWLKGEPAKVIINEIVKPGIIKDLNVKNEVLEEVWSEIDARWRQQRLSSDPEVIISCRSMSRTR